MDEKVITCEQDFYLTLLDTCEKIPIENCAYYSSTNK